MDNVMVALARCFKGPKRSKAKMEDEPGNQPQPTMFKTVNMSLQIDIPITEVHILPSESKYSFFQQEHTGHVERTVRGRNLLDGLQLIAPTTAARFNLSEDPIEHFTLKLIGKDANFTSFLALSYCWPVNQREELSPQPQSGNRINFPLPIDPLLYAALQDQLLSPLEGIWIDQICIDQQNDIEKAAAITAMPAVYRCARKVIVALGDALISTEQGEWLEQHKVLAESHGSNPTFRQLARVIFASKWFTRAWCSHEMRLATSILFLVPCRVDYTETTPKHRYLSLDATMLGKILEIFDHSVAGEAHTVFQKDQILLQHSEPMSFLALKGKTVLSVDSTQQPKELSSLRNFSSDTSYTSHAYDIFALGAGGNRRLSEQHRELDANADRAAIILNTLEEGLELQRPASYDEPDAAELFSKESLISTFMLLGLVARDPVALCASGPPFRIQPCLSWINKPSHWDVKFKRKRPLSLLPKLSLKVDKNTPLEWVELECLDLGIPSSPSERSIAVATAILTKSLSLYRDSEKKLNNRYTKAWPSFVTESATAHKVFISTVACIIECDLQWLRAASTRCAYASHSSLINKLYAYFRHNLNDFELFWLETSPWTPWNEDYEGIDAVDAILHFAYWMLSIAPGDSISLHTLTPKIFDISGKKIVIFLLENEDINPYLPVALVNRDYSVLARAWLLGSGRKVDENSSRRVLRNKTLLFGDVFEEDLLALPRVLCKVYGPGPAPLGEAEEATVDANVGDAE